jgi:hypothetical protein
MGVEQGILTGTKFRKEMPPVRPYAKRKGLMFDDGEFIIRQNTIAVEGDSSNRNNGIEINQRKPVELEPGEYKGRENTIGIYPGEHVFRQKIVDGKGGPVDSGWTVVDVLGGNVKICKLPQVFNKTVPISEIKPIEDIVG